MRWFILFHVGGPKSTGGGDGGGEEGGGGEEAEEAEEAEDVAECSIEGHNMTGTTALKPPCSNSAGPGECV